MKFNQIKTVYNTVKENWIVNDLIAKCVVEEKKLKLKKLEIVNMVGTS